MSREAIPLTSTARSEAEAGLSVEVRSPYDGLVEICAVGCLDLNTAERLRKTLDATIEDASVKMLVIVLRGLTFVDSSGLGVLLRAQRRARKADVGIVLAAPSPVFVRVLHLCELEEDFTIVAGLS